MATDGRDGDDHLLQLPVGQAAPIHRVFAAQAIRLSRSLVPGAPGTHGDLRQKRIAATCRLGRRGERPWETGHDDEPTQGLPTPAEQVTALGVGVLMRLE